MTRRSTKPSRGFGLIMMMLVIGLLAVFAVVATRLIKTTSDLYREAGWLDAEARSIDDALGMLRRDVWAATQAAVAEGGAVSIDRAGEGSVEWNVDGDGTLIRTEGAATDPVLRRWPGVGARLKFEWDGVSLRVRGADRGADRVGGIRMTSQVKLAAGGGK